MKLQYPVSLLLALTLVLTMALPVWAQKPDPGTGTSEIVPQNIDDTSDATVIVQYIDQGGNEVTTSNLTLPPYVATNIKTTDVPMLGDGWLGSAVASSDRAVAATANVFWTGGLYGEGKTAGAYAGFSEGSLNVYLPYVFNVWNRVSIISVQNTSATNAAQIAVHYVSRSGTELGTSPYNDTIPASGQVTYSLRDGTPAGKVPTVDFEGSVYITSNQPIVAVSQTHWKDFSTIYGGLASGDTFLYYPQVVRGISTPSGNWFRWSVMVVQNIAAADVTVKVTVFSEDGTEKFNFQDTIPGQTGHIYNFRYGGSEMPTSIFNNLETLLGTTNFAGSATVERIAGSGEIIGVCHQLYANPMRAFTYEALGPGMGTLKVAFPDMYRVKPSSWKTWSAAMIQNFSTTNTANVDIYFFSHDKASGGVGNADLHLSKTIAPSSRCGINTRYNTPCVPLSELSSLGENWEGSMFVISQNQNIGGIMTTIAATPKQAWAYKGTNTGP